MHMVGVAKRWTVEEVHSLPDDGNRYEVVDGVLLVTPSPSWTHQRTVGQLYLWLASYFAAHRFGVVIMAPADVVPARDTLVQPDLFVVPRAGERAPDSWREAGRMLLAIEVLSPSTRQRDRTIKRAMYQRMGVPEYWVVDLEARHIERWRPAADRPDIATSAIEWRPEGTAPALRIDVEELFREVLDR